jgi:hypothetical protein
LKGGVTPPFKTVKMRDLQLFDLENTNSLAGKFISLIDNRQRHTFGG